MSTKLPVSIIALSTATAGFTGYLAFEHSSSSLTDQAEANLEAIVITQQERMEMWLNSVATDIETMAVNVTVQDAIADFSQAWNGLEQNPTTYLQAAYISNNPNPIGQKEELDFATDGSVYSDFHAKYHPYMRTFLRNNGYYDVFLFNTEGDLIYSVFKEADYATNLVSGRWSSSDLGEAFKAARSKSLTGEVTFFDFKPYGPSADAPASFISIPVTSRSGEFIGVLAFQMPVGELNNVMKSRVGLGETGLTYMVGSDGYLRNDVPETEEFDILARQVSLTADSRSVSTGDGLFGETVLRAQRDFEFLGTKYTFVAEENKAELLAPTSDLRNSLLIQLLFSGLVVGLLGFLLARNFTKPIEDVEAHMKDMADGKLDNTVPAADRGDEIGEIAQTLFQFQEDLRKSKTLEESQIKVVESIGRALSKLSDGDLTYRISEQFTSAYENLRVDFNKTLESLEASFQSVSATTSQINDNAREISQAADDLSRRTENQAATLEQTAAAIEQMTSSVMSTASGAQRANELVGSARSNAESSGEVVDQAISAMGNIENSADQISQIVGVIDDIAFQTNLLALNAGVEAARAGDAGRGFAVVASEVRALAQRSSNAAKEIKELITESEQHVASGVQQVNHAGEALRKILESVREINEAVSGISSAAQEQSAGLSEINSAVSQLDQVTQQNAAMVEESTAASHTLRQDADDLGRLVAQFQTSSSQNAMRRPRTAAGVGHTITAQQERVKAFAAQGSAALNVDPQGQPNDDDWLEF